MPLHSPGLELKYKYKYITNQKCRALFTEANIILLTLNEFLTFGCISVFDMRIKNANTYMEYV